MEPRRDSGQRSARIHRRVEEGGLHFRNEMETGPGGRKIQIDSPLSTFSFTSRSSSGVSETFMRISPHIEARFQNGYYQYLTYADVK